jgi:hypothetical protein
MHLATGEEHANVAHSHSCDEWALRHRRRIVSLPARVLEQVRDGAPLKQAHQRAVESMPPMAPALQWENTTSSCLDEVRPP